MKCIIVDDEPLAREGMRLNVEEVESLELIGTFDNAMQANEFLTNNEVDVMFLDIQMPGMTGLDFIKTLKNSPIIIITTAYPQFALESFDLDVIDYLVKPIRIERFIKAVNKAKEYHDLKSGLKSHIESFEENYIFVKSDRKYVKIFFSEINYIEGLKDYVIIHTDKIKIMTAMNLKTIHNKLPEEIFARVNKSFIININHIKEIDSDYVVIKDNEVPIGRIYKDEFIEKYVNKRLIKR
ncbi:MAG: DNA-binding response regulator [Bacteroidetes bacterium GWF2_38_335]|nr:MAG: DNA-binding response regulator [Bacteroidetes bacterium GWF2_38_335]OFY76898.1 MAG: DNA-binding response regulator [Bacteroidetes bacterium RIFOXYA12_FULL_38_20]HBS86746.1 DNA-binding response regulator [Bacteroidales bacterium]